MSRKYVRSEWIFREGTHRRRALTYDILPFLGMNFLTRFRFLPRVSTPKVMSFEDSVSRLGSAIKDLVASAAKDDPSLAGKSEKDQAEVVQWIEKVGQGDIVKADNFKVRIF